MKTITFTLKAKVFSGLAVTALAISVLAAPATASGAQASDLTGGAQIQISETGTTTLAASRVSRICVRKHRHDGHAPPYGWNHYHFYPCFGKNRITSGTAERQK